MHVSVLEAISVGLGFLAIVAPSFWPKMSSSISYSLAAVGFAWLSYSGVLFLQDVSGMRLQYGPLTLILVGATCVAAGTFWHIHQTHRQGVFSAIDNPAKSVSEPSTQTSFKITGEGSRINIGEYQQYGKSQSIADISGKNNTLAIAKVFVSDNLDLPLTEPMSVLLGIPNKELRERAKRLTASLRQLQFEIDDAKNTKDGKLDDLPSKGPDRNIYIDSVLQEYTDTMAECDNAFTSSMLSECRVISGAIVAKTGPIELPQSSLTEGYEHYRYTRKLYSSLRSIQSGMNLGRPGDIADLVDFMLVRLI